MVLEVLDRRPAWKLNGTKSKCGSARGLQACSLAFHVIYTARAYPVGISRRSTGGSREYCHAEDPPGSTAHCHNISADSEDASLNREAQTQDSVSPNDLR